MKKKTMKDYIIEAPHVCRENIKNYKNLVQPLLELTDKKKVNTLWLIASGSSFNSCHCAYTFMNTYLDFDIKIVTPYTFVYYENNIKENDLVIVITQSGLSTNAIEAIKKVKELGYYAVCLSGSKNSDVKDYADVVVEYGVGEELVGYVTKGVTTLCLYLMLFTVAYSKKDNLIIELENAVLENEKMIKKSEAFIERHYKSFSSMNHIYFCGAGSHYGTALEGSLKAGETIHIPSCFYEIEEYIHGPNLQLTPDYPVILFDGNDLASERVQQVYLASKEVSDKVYLIGCFKGFEEDDHVLSLSSNVLSECASLACLPFVQLLCHKISCDLQTTKQHPLLRNFKKIASAKTENFVNYDGDD